MWVFRESSFKANLSLSSRGKCRLTQCRLPGKKRAALSRRTGCEFRHLRRRIASQLLMAVRTLGVLVLAARVWGAEPLTLREAVQLSLRSHPSLEALAEKVKAAEAGIGQARAGAYPRLTYSELFQTSNNPVFAFSSILAQRRFAESNFRIDALNNPGFVNNFQSQAGVEAILHDFGATRARVAAATAGRKMTEEQERLARMELVARVARTYHGVVLAEEARKVAQSALRSAEADLARAEALRAAGMSTDADVLSIKVHLAQAREQEIRRKYDIEVARAALNEALGVELGREFALTTPLSEARKPEERTVTRPEVRQAELAGQMAEAQRAAARTSMYPRIVAQGMFEADRGRFVTRAGANWFLGGGLKWSLSTGGAEKRQAEEAAHNAASARARQREAAAAIELQIRQARAALAAAGERVAVAEAAVGQAEESLRITQNRYEAGLTTVHELLRNESAVLESRMRRLAAIHDQRLAAVMVDFAQGTLSGDSDVLN